MKHKAFALLAILLIVALAVSVVQADEIDNDIEVDLDEDYPWRNHEDPFGFEFDNMIDTHQQSFVDANGVLHGFIYIHIVDVAEDGIPIAEKADCVAYPEECTVGWVIKGIPYSATLVHKGPRVWLVDPAGLPKEPEYSHFHWLESPYKPHGLVMDTEIYNGYLLKRVAVTTFYWLGGNGQGGSGGEGETGGCGGGCSGEDHVGDEGGCSGGGGSDMGGSDMDDGCSGEDHTGDESGCSDGGGDMGGGNPGHGGRLVIEGLDSHSNITTYWDGTWQGGGCDD